MSKITNDPYCYLCGERIPCLLQRGVVCPRRTALLGIGDDEVIQNSADRSRLGGNSPSGLHNRIKRLKAVEIDLGYGLNTTAILACRLRRAGSGDIHRLRR